MLGAGSVELEDGLSAVQLVKQDGAVALCFVEGGLDKKITEGDGADGRAKDTEVVCDFGWRAVFVSGVFGDCCGQGGADISDGRVAAVQKRG